MRNVFYFALPIFLSVIVSISTITILDNYLGTSSQKVLSVEATPIPTPLAKYSIESLSNKKFVPKPIEIGELIEDRENSESYIFSHRFDPAGDNKSEKTVTGVLNIPKETGSYPIVILLRGYVDKEIYSPGLGTRNAGIYFSENGFLTIAPDFLGYGESDVESFDIFEARFQTYTTVLSILNSLTNIEKWDGKNVFIWAHSNGGQVALSTLAITEKNIPTTLWAPVSKSFPYSIMFYTDELIDEGKYLRNELSKFEKLYDVTDYSFTNYLDKIKAPLQIHQGGNDDAVPLRWSVYFSELLTNNEIEHELFIYPNADHNLRPNWDQAILRDLNFFIDNIN